MEVDITSFIDVLSYKNINFSIKDLHIIDNFSIDLKTGESISIIGPSGCGKTTLLKILLGIHNLKSGIEIKKIDTNKLAVVFQDENLIPWMNVAQNIKLLNILNNKNIQEEVFNNIINQFDLIQFTPFYPVELSGGMQQKVSLARSLSYDPHFYFLDESMSNLDDYVKFRLCDILYSKVVKERRSILNVTHNLSDALHISDKIIFTTSRPMRTRFVFENTLPRERDYSIRFDSQFKILMDELHKWISNP